MMPPPSTGLRICKVGGVQIWSWAQAVSFLCRCRYAGPQYLISKQPAMPSAKQQPKIVKFLPPEALVRWIFEAVCLSAAASQRDEIKLWETIRKHCAVFTRQHLHFPPCMGERRNVCCRRRLLCREVFVLRGLRTSLIATCFTTECGCVSCVYTNGFAVWLGDRTVNPSVQKGEEKKKKEKRLCAWLEC